MPRSAAHERRHHGRTRVPRLERHRREVPSLRRDFVDELRWTVRHRRGWLIGFAVNLVAAAIFLGYQRYDPDRQVLRVAGLAAELAAWVLASTLATNQLGEDADQVLASVRYDRNLTRMLVLKNFVLFILLVPITFGVSVAVQLDESRLHELLPSVAEDLLDEFVLGLWLGIGSLTSVLLPYRPMPLRSRWQQRSTWPRWAACQAVPYLIVLTIIPALVWPPYDVAKHLFGGRHTNLVEYASTFTVWGVFIWIAGLALSALYVRRWPDRVLAALEHPS
jgi:hypothetical protein